MFKREWTKELEQKALDEIHEVPNKKEEDLRHMKEWLLTQPHLNARSDTEWILNFLRGCKFNIQKTKEKFEYLYRTKNASPEFYSNRDPLLPELQEIITRCILVPHSTKNEELIILRWGNADVNKVSLINLFKFAFMIIDVALMESSSSLVLGHHVIVDFQNFPLRYVKQMFPSVLNKFISTVVKGYPIRIKGIYFFNVFPYFPTIFSMVAPLFGKKILARVKMYDNFNLKELSKYVSISSPPKEYYGTSDSIYEIGGCWKLQLESYRKWFLEDEQYKADVK